MKMVTLKQTSVWKRKFLVFSQQCDVREKKKNATSTCNCNTCDGSIAAQSAQHYVEELLEELKLYQKNKG